MKRILRRTGVVAVIAAALAILAPSAAYAWSDLPNNSALRQPYDGNAEGTDVVPMYNSSHQQIGTYQLKVNYWYGEYAGTLYNVEVTICVKDTLANGRGVVARVLLKWGTNESKEVGKFRDKSGCYGAVYKSAEGAVWAVDVDHGEIWSGVPYQYTGTYNRYTSAVGAGPYWPVFTT
ncbi:hypothetical protein ACFQFC_11065 [Amorphoplanes digitatis]|uniref:Secreted protein n=1 Tax=Actinoplanes digitatis TaxID=1868 RepID=A0A7W7MRW9_9ACTN|nr:hypothetical protein [Actinoplanes digitatis]MBB4764738.1 hypothetical protein [Actinoplanes digitatis]